MKDEAQNDNDMVTHFRLLERALRAFEKNKTQIRCHPSILNKDKETDDEEFFYNGYDCREKSVSKRGRLNDSQKANLPRMTPTAQNFAQGFSGDMAEPSATYT